MIYITIFAISLLFFIIQLDLSKLFVFSDANLYLYYADQISKGSTLYKDLYMTNFPLVPYISVFYKYITFGSIHGFYMTACIEALISAGVLFWSLKKIYKDNLVSATGAIFYLSSFLVFSSANHQNGVLLAVLFFNIAYLCFLYKKYFLTGIFLGLSLMAKAYMAPVILAFLVYLLIKKRHALFNTIFAIAGIIAIILLPTILFAYTDFINQVFGYSLSRSAGFDKGSMIWSLITNDPLVVALMFYSVLRWRKHLFPALATILIIIFLFLYQDLYLLYFNMFVPIAVLSLGDLTANVKKQSDNPSIVIALLGLIIVVNYFNLSRYINSIQGYMAIPNIEEFVGKVQDTQADYLYGEYGIVQGISYLSEIPMLEGISDTNRKLFLSGILDKDAITSKIKKTKTVIISYSSGDNFDIGKSSAILDWSELKNYCKVVYRQDFKMSYPVNKLNIIKCL